MEPNTQQNPSTDDQSAPIEPSAPASTPSQPLTPAEPSIRSSFDDISRPSPEIHKVVQPNITTPHALFPEPGATEAPVSDMITPDRPLVSPTPRLGEQGRPFEHRVITPTSPAQSTVSPSVMSSIPDDEVSSSAPVITIGGPGDSPVGPNLNDNAPPNVYPVAVSSTAAGLTDTVTPLNAISASRSTPPLRSRRKKMLLAGGATVVVLLGGAAAFYFGYYTNPSVIYAQSLKNTGKGYDALVNYATTQSKIKYQSVQGSGSFNYKSSSFTTDGTMTFKSDNNSNGELTFDVGDGIGRLNTDIRTIKSTTTTPDVYVKVGGLKDIASLLLGTSGDPQVDATVNKLDNTWIAIDHTTIENIQNSAAAAAGSNAATTPASSMAPSQAQITDELRAFGSVNQQYLFSTDKNKAVTTVVKNYGRETIGDHKTYHYQVALNKANVKKYITAQQNALKTSKLGSWLKQSNYDSTVQTEFTSLQQSADNLKSSDTFDVWADINQRVIYKLRFSNQANNPAENYIDVGLNYKGGDNYPFFISGQSKSGGQLTTGSLIATLNTKSNSVGLKVNVTQDGSSGGTLTGTFNFQPSNASIQIVKPTGAVTLAQILNDLGLGDILNAYTQPPVSQAPSSIPAASFLTGGTQAQARDAKRQADIAALQTQLEAYFSETGNYPSLADMNNPTWLAAHMKSLDQNALVDPSNPTQNKKLAAKPDANIYAYQVTDANGKSCEADDTQCTNYTLTATLETSTNGSKLYTKANLD